MIDEKQTARALGSVHASFYLSPHTVSIGLIGPGSVGSVFLDQLASQVGRLTRRLQARPAPARHPDVEDRWCSPTRPCRWREWRESLDGGGPPDLQRFVRHVDAEHLPHAVIVDCTASADVARHYPDVARRRHPRRHAEQAGRQRGPGVLPDARRGAPRRTARTTSTRRRSAPGCRSSRRCATCARRATHPADRGHPLGHAVVSLQRLGRRAAVLRARPRREGAGLHRAGSARRSLGHGRRAQADHPGARDGPRPRARRRRARGPRAGVAPVRRRRRVPRARAARSTRRCASASRRRARAATCCATSGGSTPTRGRATVGLVELDRSHLFANISLTDNVVSFTTSRYDRNPLVVRGPGAGPAVTAGGVFADLLRVCAYLGAHV